MDPIDAELPALYEAVREGLSSRAGRSRRRRMADAARELDLKPGSDLRALVTRLDKNFSPEDQHGFELMIGTQMLFYCFNTHAGNALARVATDERKDPPTVIADLIVAANARRVQLEKAPAQRKAAK